MGKTVRVSCHRRPALPDDQTETDELFQHAGETSEQHADPMDPPRRRANKQRGRGTDDHDRPPMVGTIGRQSGHVRVRVVPNTTGETLQAQVHPCTHAPPDGPHRLARTVPITSSACMPQGTRACMNRRAMRMAMACARVHGNTAEGRWTDIRHVLRPAERRSPETPGWFRGDW
jgi:transposase